MRQQTAKLHQWAVAKAASPKAPLWVTLLFSLEIFLFVPLDPILMFFCLENRRKTFLYASLAALASTMSAFLGYLVGHFLWDLVGPYLVPQLISPSSFERLAGHLQLYEGGAIFLGSLLPFPIKVLSLGAGIFELGVAPFLLYMLIGRLLRFSLVGGAMVLWGDPVKLFVEKHFHRILVVVGAKLALGAFAIWALT